MLNFNVRNLKNMEEDMKQAKVGDVVFTEASWGHCSFFIKGRERIAPLVKGTRVKCLARSNSPEKTLTQNDDGLYGLLEGEDWVLILGNQSFEILGLPDP